MALTAAEVEKAKKLIQIKGLELDIDTINKTAFDAQHVKQDEITVIENKRISDVQVKTDAIKTLTDTYG